MNDYMLHASSLVGESWTALENGRDCLKKLKAVQDYKVEMETHAKELLSDMAGWAVGFEYWHTLDNARSILAELYQIRAGIIEIDDFEDSLANSLEWRMALTEAQKAA